jgi:LPXTG-motif cell wall-anchored protein
MDTYELALRPSGLRPALPKTFWWATASIVLMPIGAFGPWATVFGVLTYRGTDGNAGWTVVGAAALAAIATGFFARRRRRWLCVVMFLSAAAATATAAYNLNDIRSLNTSLEGVDLMSTGWGIYVALAGSVSLLLASIVLGAQTERRGETIVIPGSAAKARLRRPWGVFFLSIVTFGLYHLYWYYEANRELKDYGAGTSPVLSLLAQFPGAFSSSRRSCPGGVSLAGSARRRVERVAPSGSTTRRGSSCTRSRSSCCRSSSYTPSST